MHIPRNSPALFVFRLSVELVLDGNSSQLIDALNIGNLPRLNCFCRGRCSLNFPIKLTVFVRSGIFTVNSHN